MVSLRKRWSDRKDGQERTAISLFIPSIFSLSWLLSRSLRICFLWSSVVSKRSLDEPAKVRLRVDSCRRNVGSALDFLDEQDGTTKTHIDVFADALTEAREGVHRARMSGGRSKNVRRSPSLKVDELSEREAR